MADYPAALHTATDPTANSKTNSPSHATQHINHNAEIIAIETELGIDVAGAYSNTVTRLDAELGCLHFNIIAAAGSAITTYFTAPYACTLSGYANFAISTGTGRTVSVAHGSAGDNVMATATQVTTGTIGVAVAMAASATATVTAAEVIKVTCTSCATAQVYGVTVIMTDPT